MEPEDLITGSEAARLAGVNQSTWSRWVASGKAPQPAHSNGVNLTLFSRKDVEAMAAGKEEAA